MDNILDYIVSESWCFMTVFILLCSVPTLMIMRRPFKKLVPARITQIGVSLLAFGALMYLLLGPNGYAYQFVRGLSNGKEICLIEQHYQGDGDAGSHEEYRLYVLDLKTGERKLRRTVESSELLCVTENSAIIFEWNGAKEYNLFTGEEMRVWTKESGFEKFPELKSGIIDLNRQSGWYKFKNEAWLTITAKDGHYYCYNLLTDQLTPEQYPTEKKADNFNLDEYELSYKNPADDYKTYYNFETKTGEIEQLVYHHPDYSTEIYNGEFLDPQIVAYDAKNEFFVIHHFETLEKKHALFSAVTFDLKPLWRTEQRKIAPSDKVGDDPSSDLAFQFENYLITTFGGTVVLLNMTDGSVIWSVSL